MAKLNFPPFTNSDPDPSNGDVWTAPNGTQWEYDISIPAWKALANPGPGVRYRGGIDLNSSPQSQYDKLESGNLFTVTVGDTNIGAGYPGLTNASVSKGAQVIFDGTEWQAIAVTIPYATKQIAGKVELATQAEAELGEDDTKALTPQTGKKSIPEATSSKFGKTQYATRNETTQAIRDDRAVTPYGLANILQLIDDLSVNRVPVGMIMWHSGITAPDGWIICDGDRVYDQGGTKDLYNHLRTVKGRPWGDDPVVRVPDLRGRFIRGNNLDATRDPANPEFGLSQNDQMEEHEHTINDPGHDHDLDGYTIDDNDSRSVKVIIDDERASRGNSDNSAVQSSKTGINKTETTGGVENRPKNLNLLPCIKL